MTTKDKRRRRDSHVKTTPARKAADDFIEAFTTDHGKGKITRAAQKAYPNQSRASAAQTGHELLKDPYVQEQIRLRQETVATLAGISRNMLAGNLVACIFTALDDIVGKDGYIDWELARARGIAHLIQEISITERHSKDGGYRTTTTFKMPSKLHAMDLLSELTGWKKERAKNPVDAARETYLIMRQNENYKDMPDEELAKFPAQRFNVSMAEILEGQS